MTTDKFTKDMLKTGMRVKYGNHPDYKDTYGIVVRDLDKIFLDGGWNNWSNLTDDLKMKENPSGYWTITAVYDMPGSNFHDHKICGKLLWERKEETKTSPREWQFVKDVEKLRYDLDQLQATVAAANKRIDILIESLNFIQNHSEYGK